ncbi:MAG TPA: hypothetical protein VKW04_13950, partial [Planctomycetota bacterium]|nr:hypothetical protein [Planctomycetota bacterium]
LPAATPAGGEPLSQNPNLQSMLGLAVACDQASKTDPGEKQAVLDRRATMSTQSEALQYIRSVDDRITKARKRR